jgi:hypothetical protein
LSSAAHIAWSSRSARDADGHGDALMASACCTPDRDLHI